MHASIRSLERLAQACQDRPIATHLMSCLDCTRLYIRRYTSARAISARRFATFSTVRRIRLALYKLTRLGLSAARGARVSIALCLG